MSSISLVYISSDAIRNFCANHPIDWGDKELANGPGNIQTPTPALEVFFRLLGKTGNLFTQKEYIAFAEQEWNDWWQGLTEQQQEGLRHRLYRNFYPSAIDSIHVWSLLVETGRFDKCILDTANDSVGKTDITVWPILRSDPIKIALYVDSSNSRRWTNYKRANRGNVDHGTIDIKLPIEGRPRRPGNKRWYNLDDLDPIFQRINDVIFSAA